jgi:predicted aminopeptidase
VSRAARLALAVLLGLSLSGCATGYVLRAAYEEARILCRRQPIEAMLAGDLAPATRAKLELVLSLRRFAAEQLGLRVGGSYASVATVEAGQIVQVVSAAPRDRLVPYTWWFPIVGDVPYRGYFDRADADALATELQHEGYDTDVRAAIAFSTLGWFDDPLLSTLLEVDEERLAETVVHELLHNTIYVPSQAAFNESFATFVGHRGAAAFFAARGDAPRGARAAARWIDALTFSDLLGRFVDTLQAAYARGIDGAERDALFAAARARCAGQQWLTDEYRGFARRPLNNAVILHDQLYADRLGLFESAYAANGEDLRATIAFVRAAASDAPDPFAALAARSAVARSTARWLPAGGSPAGSTPPAP